MNAARSFRLAFVFTAFLVACPEFVAADTSEQAVASTLRTIFSPRRAPAQRTMGLSQRSFLDLVEQSPARLEIALVIDGTESMGPALVGVREAISQMMADLDRYKQQEVAYQIVVFRDVGAPSGEVVYLLEEDGNRFTTDRQAVLAALSGLQVEIGAPYFPELVDEGVHAALSALAWSTGDEASRWIFLFADAPPFDPTFREESTGARRRFATDALIAIASENQILINCVLCPTRVEDEVVSARVVDQTRTFLNSLSSGTGGLMLDLSSEEIRTAILAADRRTPEVDYASIQTIRQADVERLRQDASQQDARPVRIAILPHAPLEAIGFSAQAPATKLAAELRLRLKSIPGVVAAEPLLIERRLRQLQRNPNYSGLRGQGLLQAIGKAVDADYLLWGDLPSEGQAAATRLYDVATGEVLAEVERQASDTLAPGQLGALLAGDVLNATIDAAAHRPLATHLAAVQDNPLARERVTRQIAATDAHGDLMAGLAALESALSYPSGDAEGRELLAAARGDLERAAQLDDDNALPRFLLASCLYNLAQQAPAKSDEQSTLLQSFAQNLRAAYRFRNALPDGGLRREIEADYALLVRQRPGEAIPRYVELADAPGGGDVARRANWMLAGIYSGDWGVDEAFVDEMKARERLVRILAFWPESREAQFIRQALRWNEAEEKTRFPHFPKENGPLAEQIDRQA